MSQAVAEDATARWLESIDRPWLKVGELATLLDLPIRTVHKLRQTGKAPRAVLMGRELRFHKDDILAWEAARREAAH